MFTLSTPAGILCNPKHEVEWTFRVSSLVLVLEFAWITMSSIAIRTCPYEPVLVSAILILISTLPTIFACTTFALCCASRCGSMIMMSFVIISNILSLIALCILDGTAHDNCNIEDKCYGAGPSAKCIPFDGPNSSNGAVKCTFKPNSDTVLGANEFTGSSFGFCGKLIRDVAREGKEEFWGFRTTEACRLFWFENILLLSNFC